MKYFSLQDCKLKENTSICCNATFKAILWNLIHSVRQNLVLHHDVDVTSIYWFLIFLVSSKYFTKLSLLKTKTPICLFLRFLTFPSPADVYKAFMNMQRFKLSWTSLSTSRTHYLLWLQTWAQTENRCWELFSQSLFLFRCKWNPAEWRRIAL